MAERILHEHLPISVVYHDHEQGSSDCRSFTLAALLDWYRDPEDRPRSGPLLPLDLRRFVDDFSLNGDTVLRVEDARGAVLHDPCWPPGRADDAEMAEMMAEAARLLPEGLPLRARLLANARLLREPDAARAEAQAREDEARAPGP